MAEDPTPEKKTPLTPDEVIASQRSRQLTIMAVVLLVLAGGVAATKWTKKPETPVGTVAVVTFKVEDVMGLEVFSGAGGEHVKITRDGEAWRFQNRYGALVDKDEIDGLVKKLVEAKRQTRPATEEPSRFALFELNYDQAAHVVLTDKLGKELVHLLIGKGDSANGEFIRYSAKDAPPGVFELVDSGGVLDNLRSRLHLDDEGKPKLRDWVQTTVFKTLPREAVVTRLVIHSKDAQIELESSPDPKDAGKRIWQMVKPEPSYGNSGVIDGALEAIRNMRASDVAGRPSPHGSELGIVNAERWLEVKYDAKPGGPAATLRMDFGKTKDHEVAVWATSESKGEFVWWVNDYVLMRVFRPVADFADVAPLPPPGPAVTDKALVQHILISWVGTQVPTKKPRTKIEARKQVQQVLEKCQAPGADWKALQKEFNEDGAPHTEYPVVKDDPNWDKTFTQGALSLKVGEIGLFETQFGYHIIKRLE